MRSFNHKLHPIRNNTTSKFDKGRSSSTKICKEPRQNSQQFPFGKHRSVPQIKEDGIPLSLHLAVQGQPLAIGNPNMRFSSIQSRWRRHWVAIRGLNMQDFTGRHSWDLCLRPEELSWHGCDLWLHFVTSRAGASNCCNPPGRLLALMTTWFCSNSIWKW